MEGSGLKEIWTHFRSRWLEIRINKLQGKRQQCVLRAVVAYDNMQLPLYFRLSTQIKEYDEQIKRLTQKYTRLKGV